MTYGSTITCTACTTSSATDFCSNSAQTALDFKLAYTYNTLTNTLSAPSSYALNVP